MKIDLGSFAFGSTISSGGNTPSWGTSLGQIKPALKLTYPGYDNIVIGMVYKSIPVDKVYIPIGKGGHVCNSLEDEGIQLAAMFDKVYINEVKVNASFIMLIYKEDSNSWKGRRSLKYSPKIEYHRGENDIVYNSEFINAAREALQLSEDACWLVSDIIILNQDELHMIAGIVNPYQSETYSSTELRKAAYINAIKTTYEKNSHFKKLYNINNIDILDKRPETLQQIFYGAPGTGKSNTIKQEVEDAGKRHHRTTFHPDSDYSTFVGAYKPSMSSSEKIYSIAELIVKLTEIKNTGTTYPCHKFASKYWESLKDLSANEIKQILAACGFTEAYGVEVSKGIAIGQEYLNKRAEGKIVYNFVPQTFTKAYVDAWNSEEEVFLIIEEINRGNCAQIFGDLFQLLDRKNGMSEYPIDADSDLEDYLKDKLKDSPRTDFPAGVKEGKKLVLPSNLYIWATMNTSDQSLFPIDSAFKRRWEWKYIPIKNHPEKNYKIEIGESKYDWWQFLESINREIGTITSSEDKKLGYFFAKAEDNVIKDEQFVGKVLFYLWNDVFKNYGFDNPIFSKGEVSDNESKTLEFSDFFDGDGSPNHENVNLFMKNLKIDDENKKEEVKTDEESEQ